MGIIINVLIGAVIAILIQKKLSDDRGVKDYFIKELEEITSDYRSLRSDLFAGNTNTKHLLEWFKLMSNKLTHVENFLKEDLDIQNLPLQKYNREIHILLTNSKEFNNSFNKNVTLSTSTKNEITDALNGLKHSIIKSIIEINRA